jgi:hypothetical protein
MNATAAATFTLPELWLLRSVIRHEQQGIEMWKFPPANKELNDQIARAILFCIDNGQQEAALELSAGDTYAIDYCVNQDAKDTAGGAMGKEILLKAFRARVEITDGQLAEASEPAGPSVAEVAALLAAREEREEAWPWQRRQRPQR